MKKFLVPTFLVHLFTQKNKFVVVNFGKAIY